MSCDCCYESDDRRDAAPTASTPTKPPRGDDHFDQFAAAIRHRAELMTDHDEPVFQTDADPDAMWAAYLGGFSAAADRQVHDCRACRAFITRYGGLVTVDSHGVAHPLMWVSRDPHCTKSRLAIESIVSRARVTGVFLTDDPVLGTWPQVSRKTGEEWRHFLVPTPPGARWSSVTSTASQRAAEKLEEYGVLCRSLAEWPASVVTRVHALLQSGALYRSEKVSGPAKWLLALHERLAAAGRDQRRRDCLTWLAVATAPTGYCHLRGGVLGTLLDDLNSGADTESVRRRFAEKMDPTQYQRPRPRHRATGRSRRRRGWSPRAASPAGSPGWET